MIPAGLLNPVALAITLTDPVPTDNDVKAGWTAFAVFLLLLVAVGLLGWNMRKQFRKAAAARDAGILPLEHPDKPETVFPKHEERP